MSIPSFDGDGIELTNGAKVVSVINQVKLSDAWWEYLHIAGCSTKVYLLARKESMSSKI